MAYVPPEKERSQQARPDATGKPTFDWQLSSTSLLDTVKLTVPPMVALPIVFVPGIMGSNLSDRENKPVWLLDLSIGAPLTLAKRWAGKSAGARQKILHPDRTKVYRDGNVPKKLVGTVSQRQTYSDRGWGEVSEGSYHAFLLWLEEKMNGQGFNPAKWSDFSYTSVSATPAPGTRPPEPKLFPGIAMQMNGLPMVAEDRHFTDPVLSDDLLKRAKCRFPVYACGYNWLQSNELAGNRLKERIQQIIAENNHGAFKCEQVIVVTHSMGGLVARHCSTLAGMEQMIAGVVHGVMPAVGAAVAYRRCKVGMHEESLKAGMVIGPTGREVTAVFAQAPGALQLLPSTGYQAKWLSVLDVHEKNIVNLPVADPYEEIYLVKDKWWGLVRAEWLTPDEGKPISWNDYSLNIKLAKAFHAKIAKSYHPLLYIMARAAKNMPASRVSNGECVKD